MVCGDVNKVWVVFSDFNVVLQGFIRLLGKLGEDGVFWFELFLVEDQFKYVVDGDDVEVVGWFFIDIDLLIVWVVVIVEVIVCKLVEGLLGMFFRLI